MKTTTFILLLGGLLSYVGDCLTKDAEPDKSVNAIGGDLLEYIELNLNQPFSPLCSCPAHQAHSAPLIQFPGFAFTAAIGFP